jgi:GST-like protein
MARHIVLYGAKTGNSLRASIALEEAGIQYSVHPVDLNEGEHKSAGFAELNPLGKVPVLVIVDDNGKRRVVTQSNAIMMWAADQSNGKLLPAVDSEMRSLALERYFYFVTDVIAPSHAAFSLLGNGHRQAVRELDDRVIDAIVHAEGFVSGSPYIAGNSFSIADISALTIVMSVKTRLPWDDLPSLSQWLSRVLGRPGVDRGLRAFDR